MHVHLLFVIIFVIIVGPTIFHHFFSSVVEVLFWIVLFGLAFLAFGFFCWGAQDVWDFFVQRYIDSESAHLFIDPAIAITVIVGPFLLLFDSLNKFRWTIGTFSYITKSVRTGIA